jgi:hypothetical protein
LVIGFVILAAGAIVVVTRPDKLANWQQVPPAQPRRVTPPTKAKEAAVSAYYHAIGNQDFETAYSLLTPSMQKSLTLNDLAKQWSSLRANGANVKLDVSTSEQPEGDFVPTVVTEIESYPGGYVRKNVLKGGWHVAKIDGRWFLNDRDFRTVANGSPPSSPLDGGSAPGSRGVEATGLTSTACPEQQNLRHFMLDDTREENVPSPPSDTGLGYFAEHVAELTVEQQRIVYQGVPSESDMTKLTNATNPVYAVLAAHCRLADFDSLARPERNPMAGWNTADFAPATNTDDAVKATTRMLVAAVDAEMALEARGLISDSLVERLYGPFELVIPLSTVPMKFREGSVTALASPR